MLHHQGKCKPAVGPHRATSLPTVKDNYGYQRSGNAAAQQPFPTSITGCATTPMLSRTEEARGSNPLTSAPHKPWSPAWRVTFARRRQPTSPAGEQMGQQLRRKTGGRPSPPAEPIRVLSTGPSLMATHPGLSHRPLMLTGWSLVQAACGRRGQRAAVVGDPERGQRLRFHGAGGGAGGRPANPYADRPLATPPAKVHADKAYDHRSCRAYLRRRGIRPRIARRRIDSSQRLGRHRWTIERTGPGWSDGGGHGSAMNGTPNASTPWSCWLARSSASGRSVSHGDRSTEHGRAQERVRACAGGRSRDG
jgi:hypothetical protein